MTNRPVICSCGAQYPTMAHVEQCEATDHRQAATAPASPRVEPDPDLVAQANAIIAQECGIAGVPVQMAALRIITLAQNTKLREVAEWAEQWAATLELHKADASRQRAQGALVVASHLRAMMVKP